MTVAVDPCNVIFCEILCIEDMLVPIIITVVIRTEEDLIGTVGGDGIVIILSGRIPTAVAAVSFELIAGVQIDSQ